MPPQNTGNLATVSSNARFTGEAILSTGFMFRFDHEQIARAADQLFGASLMCDYGTQDHIWLRYLSYSARELACLVCIGADEYHARYTKEVA